MVKAVKVDNIPMIMPTIPPYTNGAVLRSSTKPMKKPTMETTTPKPSVKARVSPIIVIAYFVASDI